MKIEEIVSEWKIDAKIDDLNIDSESSRVPSLHAKYIELLSSERSILRGLLIKKKHLSRTLRDYYLGVSTQEELEKLERSPYQERILKNEISTFIEADDLMIANETKISIQEEKVDVLLDIMKSIHSRSFNMKNVIEWRRLMLGG